MRELPILFSAPMVLAILAGRKTQTRRVITPRPRWEEDPSFCSDAWMGRYRYLAGNPENPEVDVEVDVIKPRFLIGDKLWVREKWAIGHAFDSTPPAEMPPLGPRRCTVPVWYAATIDADNEHSVNRGKWRPSIYMPRWASRITLEITGMRVQRVQEITEADAKAEGVSLSVCGENGTEDPPRDYRTGFVRLWQSINAKRGYGWDVNPWVWALTFKRVQP